MAVQEPGPERIVGVGWRIAHEAEAAELVIELETASTEKVWLLSARPL